MEALIALTTGNPYVIVGVMVGFGVSIAGLMGLGIYNLNRLTDHEKGCEERTVRLYDAINRVQTESNESDRRIEDKLDTIIPMIHRIDERTKNMNGEKS